MSRTRSIAAIAIGTGLVGAGLLVVPAAEPAWRAFRAGDDAVAVADYRLGQRSAADYAAEIEQALAGKDGKADTDLAASLVALADLRRVDLPPALRQRVDGAVATEGGQAPAQAWEGFIAGKATTEAALAGAVAADLTGFGDLRDLTVEAGNFISGDAVDEVKVALAAIGLTLTGATVMTLGSAAPAKVGASTVKAAHRLGRISAPLRRQLGVLAREAVDTGMLADAAKSAARLDIGAARALAGRILRPGPATAIRTLAADIGTIGGKTGYRGTLTVLDKARDAGEVSRLARVADRFGKATVGVLTMAGGAALTFASIAASVSLWLVMAVVWAISAVGFIARLGLSLARRLRMATA